MQGVNLGVTKQGFAAVTHQLDEMQGMISLTTASSILNLGVSAIGFAVIMKRIKELEKRLENAQKYLEKIDKKIDLSFYANFRAALDLALNAFTMSKGDNRRSSAMNAINRFLEAEHIYTELADKELSARSQIGDEYLLTLCLAYIAEARCYLELEEFDTAIRRFQEGKNQINTRIEKYIDLLLTSNPLVYLHPQLQGHTDLLRLTKIYQWKDPSHTENSVFEILRTNMIDNDLSWNAQIDRWIEKLPASIIEPSEIKRWLWGVSDEGRREIIRKLPNAIDEMESMIETSQRFGAYEFEVKAISQLEMSFHEWLELKPSEPNENQGNLVFIVPQEPLSL
jgi:tetratricopeptide (TPR) repeat protein